MNTIRNFAVQWTVTVLIAFVLWVAYVHGALAQEQEQENVPSPLFVVNADGTGLRQLVTIQKYPGSSCPSWSYDGKRIAFDVSPFGGNASDCFIYVVNADGTSPRELAPGNMPTWSGDSKQITFHSYVQGVTVWIINADGTGKEMLFPGYSPTWSPDGSKIAYLGSGIQGLSVYDVAKGKSIAVLRGEYSGVDYGFTWSPDSKRICFIGIRPDGQKEIAIVSAEGSRKYFKVRWQKKTDHPGEGMSWSLDGKKIVFADDETLYLLNPYGKDEPTKLEFRDPNPSGLVLVGIESAAWSPDGKKIVFVSTPRYEHPR